MSNSLSITEVFDTILDETEGDSEISVGDLLKSFNSRSYGPCLLVPSLCLLTPVGAIPFFPTIVGAVTVLVACQLAIGRAQPWIPQSLAERSVSREKVKESVTKYRDWFRWIEGLIKPRLKLMTEPPGAQFIGVLCMLLGALMPPLEVIPFAAAIPAMAVACFSVSLLSKDGLLAIIGYAFSALAAVFGFWTFS